jgi:hypothetical protein
MEKAISLGTEALFDAIWRESNRIASIETRMRFGKKLLIVVEEKARGFAVKKSGNPVFIKTRKTRQQFKLERIDKHIVEMLEMYMTGERE